MKTWASSKRNIKQPPLLFEDSQHLIIKLHNIFKANFITYWTSSRGGICHNDVIGLSEILKTIGRGKEVFLFLKSRGGDIEPTLRLINLLREYYDNVIALVPLECASAATMIALGANEIRMGPLAHLTAIDSSLTHDLSPIDSRDNRKVSVSQDEVFRIIKLWNSNSKQNDANPYSEVFKYIHPLVVGAIDRSSSLSTQICKEILSYHITDADKADRISRHLNSNYPSHSYPITLREAKRIGLNATPLDQTANDLLLDLNEIYSEMAQRALTDYDETNYHDNEILNILETKGIQIYFQNDKDWNYIREERRYQPLNDNSSWRKIELVKGKQIKTQLHIQ